MIAFTEVAYAFPTLKSVNMMQCIDVYPQSVPDVNYSLGWTTFPAVGFDPKNSEATVSITNAIVVEKLMRVLTRRL